MNTAEESDAEEVLKRLLESPELRLKCISALSVDLVTAAYKGLLRRDPDPGGLKAHSERLANNPDLAAYLKALSNSPEFRRISTLVLGINPAHPAAEDIHAVKTVFMHIPKTGGTTLHAALERCFPKERVCPERADGLHKYPAGKLASFRYFSGHFSFDSAHLIPGTRRMVTILREPMDRLVSLFNFHRLRHPTAISQKGILNAPLARAYDIRAFYSLDQVRCHPGSNNAMTRTLTCSFPADQWESANLRVDCDAMSLLPLAKERLRSFAAIGILERYQESAELIFKTLGLPIPAAIEPLNTSRQLQAKLDESLRPELQSRDAELEKIVAPLIEADQALYEFALGLFEEQLNAARAQQAQQTADRPEN